MKYYKYRIILFFDQTCSIHEIVAVDLKSALADIAEAYGETPELYQYSIIG